MSLRVLVIPEDPTHNGYILKPIAEMILADIGKPNAKVELLTNPRLTGYDAAVQAIRNDLAPRYSFMDLWLFFPDADRANEPATRRLEDDLASKDVTLLCCPAMPEVEVYACVGYRDEIEPTWAEVRTHPRMKETIFEPLLRKYGDLRRPGGGRKSMTQHSIANRRGFYELCPEMAQLRDRIKESVTYGGRTQPARTTGRLRG